MSMVEAQVEAARRPLRENRVLNVWRRLRRRSGAVVGLAFIVLVLVLAVFAPWIAQIDPLKQDYTAIRKGPSRPHHRTISCPLSAKRNVPGMSSR